MKAIILAAGKGARLRPLTYAIPKPLLPVGGKPVIDYVIENLAACGSIDEAYVAVSHMSGVIENYFSHSTHHGLKITVVKTLGWETGGDIKAVLGEHPQNGPVLVCYGDNVTNLDVSKLVASHNEGSNATVALFPVPKEDVPRFGIAEMSGNKIARFVEKPRDGETNSNLANAGYFVLDPGAMEKIPMGKFKVESEYFPKWAEEGRLAGQVQKLRLWIDIGTIEAYRSANRLVEEILPPPARK